MFTQKNVTSVYKGEFVGKEILYFDSTASTNDRAFEIGRQREDPEGLVIVADAQTQGRGRLGRDWISPAGVNLYFTLLLRPPGHPEDAALLSLAAPVAVVSAIRNLTGLAAKIKWPNDVMINSRKTGGILLEMKSGSSGAPLTAVGIGINVNMLPETLPTDIRSLSTSLKAEKGGDVDRLDLLRETLEGLERYYKFLLNGHKGALINEWIRLNSTIGSHISVSSHDSVITGMAHGINDKGELLLRLVSGEIKTIRAGDVTILKDNQERGDTGI